MKIQPINNNIDILIPSEIDLDNTNPVELIEQIELENKLYYFERMKLKERRHQRRYSIISVLRSTFSDDITGYILINKNTPQTEMKNMIEVKQHSIINLNILSAYLQEIIIECCFSDNEMWFVEYDNEDYLRKL